MRESNTCSRNICRSAGFFTTDLPLSKGTALDLLVDMPEQVRR